MTAACLFPRGCLNDGLCDVLGLGKAGFLQKLTLVAQVSLNGSHDTNKLTESAKASEVIISRNDLASPISADGELLSAVGTKDVLVRVHPGLASVVMPSPALKPAPTSRDKNMLDARMVT